MIANATTTCRHCGTGLTFRGLIAYVDDSNSRRGADGHGHAPAPMRTSDLLDLIYGDEGAGDPLTSALRRVGN